MLADVSARAAVLLDLPPPDHTPEQAREAADRVLQRPEYRWEERESLLDKVARWLADRFADLLEPLPLHLVAVPAWRHLPRQCHRFVAPCCALGCQY